MKKNMGTADRMIRILIAVFIGVLFISHVITGALGIVLVAIAGVFLLTSLMGVCPLYSLFGINSTKVKKA